MRATDRDVLPCDPTRVTLGFAWQVMPTRWEGRSARCSTCLQGFRITAAEQQFWYVTLGISLSVDITACAPCRRKARAHRRIIGRLSELLPLIDSGSVTPAQARETVLCIAEGAQLCPHRCSEARLLYKPRILEKGIVIARRLHENDKDQVDLLPAVAFLHRLLGNTRAAERAMAEADLVSTASPQMRKRIRHMQDWLASPSSRGLRSILKP